MADTDEKEAKKSVDKPFYGGYDLPRFPGEDENRVVRIGEVDKPKPTPEN